MKTKNMTALHLGKSSDQQPLRRGLVLIAVVFACFGLSPIPKAFGVTPAPDGGYANENTAEGTNALLSLTTGIIDTANGVQALFNNTYGSANTAEGTNVLFHNTSGNNNTANGFEALFRNTTGASNIALGSLAGLNLTTGSNNIDIGNQGVATEANTIRIGTVGNQTNTFIAGISGVTVAGGVGVIIDTNGHLGTTTSSARFKD